MRTKVNHGRDSFAAAAGPRGMTGRRLDGARFLRRAAACLLLLLTFAHAARALCNDSCDAEPEVSIGYQGNMCAWAGFSLTLNGTTAEGYGDGCHGIHDYTPKTYTKLKLDKTYQMTAGSAICITTVNFDVPRGYTLYVDGKEANQIYKSEGGFVFTGDGTWDIVVRKECPCESDGGGEATPGLGSVNWQVGMGQLSDGRSAERISLREQALSAAIYTPAALVYSPPGMTNEVDVVRDAAGLRQVKAPQYLADVVTASGAEYEVRYYRASDVGAKSGGLYAVAGQPFVTWVIKNPDPTTTSRLLIQKKEGGAVVDQSEYAWDAAVDSWSLSTGWVQGTGLYSRVESSAVSYPTQSSRTETFVVKDGGGQISSRSAATYLTFPWGEELVQEVLDPGGANLVTTYAYYEDPEEDWTYRKLKSITFPDGSWEKYQYDFDWNVATVLRPWKDVTLEAADASNSHATLYDYDNHDGYEAYGYYRFLKNTQEWVEGKVVRNTLVRRWGAYDGVPLTVNGEPVVREETVEYPLNSYALTRKTTRTSYARAASPFLAYRVADVEHPDGRKDTYTYEKGNYAPHADPALSQFTPDPAGPAVRETVVHGTLAAPGGAAFKTTKETTVTDGHGNRVMQETYVYNGATYERVGWAVSGYDDRGHLTQTARHTGQTSTAVWQGERKVSEIDEGGIETTYTYDELGRIKTSTKKGVAAGGGFPAQPDVTTTFVYDADGRQLSEKVEAAGLSLTQSAAYDRAGRVRSKTDPAGLRTSYAYAGGGRTQTVTRPGGATEITDKYIDGQAKSVTGTGVVARHYDYGVDYTTLLDATQYTKEFVGGGLNSARWVKTTTDWLGREIKVERPGSNGTALVRTSAYNVKGQPQSESTLAGAVKIVADRLYEHDELGEQIRAGSDIDANGSLAPASTDRIKETATAYEKVGGDWFKVTTIMTYLADNDPAPTTQTRRERLNNFPAGGAGQTVSDVTVTDAAGNATRITTAVERGAKKVTTATDTPDSNVSAVSVTVNGLLQSSAPPRPESATTYSYDALGRQTAASDPRAGTTTRGYDAATGRLSSTGDAVSTTNYEYYLAEHASAGRLKSRTNAGGKKVYFNYSSRGELIQTWGDATYPLEYVYDAYGQMTELRTFRGGQNWGAAAWPAASAGTADVTKWIYQDATGLLTQKQDAALKGAGYTYDELGRLKTRMWARTDGVGNAVRATYSYDPRTGELTGIDYSDGTPDVAFTYDRGGRQSGVTDAAGAHARVFNARGNLRSDQITGGLLDGVRVTVNYDQFLRRDSLTASRAAATLISQTYGYDAASRLETVTSGAQTATYAYHPNTGLLNTNTFAGGTQTARSYDALGRLQTVSTATPAAGTVAGYTYTYNNLSQRTRVTREDGSYWSYTYNDRGELASGKRYWADATPVWGEQAEYEYDTIGNRKAVRSGGNATGGLRQSSYAATSLNQYAQRTNPGAVDVAGTAHADANVSVNGQAASRRGAYFHKELAVDNSASAAYARIDVVGARQNYGAGGEDAVTERGGRAFVPPATETYGHDADGNLTSDGRWRYSWDGENRLVGMEALAGVPAEAKLRLEFAYDAAGRRVQKKVYGWDATTSAYQLQAVTKFVYDGWNLVAELDGSGLLVRSYSWGGDARGGAHRIADVGLLTIGEGGATHQVGHDGSGNVGALIDAATGQPTGSYDYDPFGQTVKAVGPYAAGNPLRLSAKYTDAETGLVYYGFRYYEPQAGRWVSRDPVEVPGERNPYEYVLNDPANNVDELGNTTVRPQQRLAKWLGDDWAGVEILDRYFSGEGGDYWIKNDAEWANYMMAENGDTGGFRMGVRAHLREIAEEIIRGVPTGRLVNVDQHVEAFLSNGENRTGYNFLHGSNAQVGGFHFFGKAQKRKGGEGKHRGCYRVDFDLTYRWNDIIDPNPDYFSDKVKNAIVEGITFGKAHPYTIHIEWKQKSIFERAPRVRGPGIIDLSKGWPFQPSN